MAKARQTERTLSEYIELLGERGILLGELPAGAAHLDILHATCDSREVAAGTLFVCKGAAFKREYLVDSIARGAVAYVSERDYQVDVPCLLVSDVRLAMALIADASYSHPSGALQVCGITGTKGKTTTAYYLKAILDARARRLGWPATPLFSSVVLDDGVTRGPSKLTTPEPFDLERHFANAIAAGAHDVVMEASSQALKYDRTYAVDFAVGVFTNIGEDHISPIEHPTFEDYFSSKLKLFSQSRRAVVDLDLDKPEHVERVLAAARAVPEGVLTYSLVDAHADVFAEALEHTEAGIRLSVRTPGLTCSVTVPTPVRFNASNALAAVAAALSLGVDDPADLAGISTARVPGRMELFPTSSGTIVGVVDYAHNGMSLETLLKDLRENYPDRELCVVFGATGGKGVDRRETMGVAAGKFADRIVITEDDPGPEDPADICRAIAENVEAQGNHAYQIVLDRPEAIRTAVRETTRPAVVIVTGKGQEDRMMRKNGPEPCETDGVLLKRALEEFERSA